MARPPLNITNIADAQDELRSRLGAGILSGFFLRSDGIVHTPRESEDGYVPPPPPPPGEPQDFSGPAQVQPVDASLLAAKINARMWTYTVKTGTGGNTATHARYIAEHARDILAAPDECPSLRHLRGVTHTPIVRSDGSVLSSPGYDPASGYLYLPTAGLSLPPVPASPSASDVHSAASLLVRMTSDFAWVHEGHRTNYLGAMLTPLIRDIAPPPYQMAVFTAPSPGSGKSYLVNALRFLHGGALYGSVPDTEEELRKRITSALLTETAPVVTFDNVRGAFTSATLEGLLTSARWSDRQLGVSRQVSLPNDRLWCITGNNAQMAGDLQRRTLWISIDPGVPSPESRSAASFHVGDYQQFVIGHRGEILHALLVLVRAWAAAGGPVPALTRSDEYATWTQVVSGILAHAGLGEAFSGSETVKVSADPDAESWAQLLSAIRHAKGSDTWTVRELLTYTEQETKVTRREDGQPVEYVASHRPIVEALPDEVSQRIRNNDPLTCARSLGKWLRNREGRFVSLHEGQACVRECGDDGHKVLKWRVELLNPETPVEASSNPETPVEASSLYFYSSGSTAVSGSEYPWLCQNPYLSQYVEENTRHEWGRETPGETPIPDDLVMGTVSLNGDGSHGTDPKRWLMAVLDAAGSQPIGKSPRQCPAHEDAAPSMTVDLDSDDGKLLVHCFAGCEWREILTAIGMDGKLLHGTPGVDPAEYARTLDLTFPPLEHTGGPPAAAGFVLEATHDYGSHLLERWRHPSSGKKDLRWHTKRDGVAIPGLFGVPLTDLPLYREKEIHAAMALGEPVLLVESESSVDALKGWYATTWPGGATAEIDLGDLAGYSKLVMIPDMDAAGLAVASRLKEAGVIEHLVFANPGEDAKDLYARADRDEFECLITEALT